MSFRYLRATFHEFVMMAEHEVAVFSAKVHAPTLAVAEKFASIAGF
jgi:hypothetical protein